MAKCHVVIFIVMIMLRLCQRDITVEYWVGQILILTPGSIGIGIRVVVRL